MGHPFAYNLLFELLKPFGFKKHQIEALFELISRSKSSPSKIYESTSHQTCIDNKGRLLISLIKSDISPKLIQKGDSLMKIGEHELKIEKVELKTDNYSSDNKTIFVDDSLLEFPLQVRRWAPGDYFYPFGLGKKKKIARFLIDEKVNKIAKEKQLVLTSGKKIVWVFGRRLDDRFKVTEKTTEVLKIEFT